jgi:hypothetical protein
MVSSNKILNINNLTQAIVDELTKFIPKCEPEPYEPSIGFNSHSIDAEW